MSALSPPLDLPRPDITLPLPPLTTAGSPLTLNCSATVVEHLVVPTVLQWLAPDGTTLTTTGDPSIMADAAVTGQVFSTSALVFMSLRTSHAGQYRCRASISIPTLPPVQSEETTNVTVQSKPAWPKL